MGYAWGESRNPPMTGAGKNGGGNEMKAKDKRLVLLAGLAAWIVFIFVRSLQPGTASNGESRWMLELLQRCLGWLPIQLNMHLVRKLAHFTEFAVLGALAGGLFGLGRRGRLWRSLFYAAVVGGGIALCDETIQLFVAGRNGQVKDVWLDLAGAVTGVVVVTLALYLRRKKEDCPPAP